MYVLLLSNASSKVASSLAVVKGPTGGLIIHYILIAVGKPKRVFCLLRQRIHGDELAKHCVFLGRIAQYNAARSL